jgi:hypothetical protein
MRNENEMTRPVTPDEIGDTVTIRDSDAFDTRDLARQTAAGNCQAVLTI